MRDEEGVEAWLEPGCRSLPVADCKDPSIGARCTCRGGPASASQGDKQPVQTASALLNEAWAWGFEHDLWRAHLNPLTWPEVLRQVAISCGWGPRRKKTVRQVAAGFVAEVRGGRGRVARAPVQRACRWGQGQQGPSVPCLRRRWSTRRSLASP